MTADISKLPENVLVGIVKHLELPDKLNFSRVCDEFLSAFIIWTKSYGTTYDHPSLMDPSDTFYYFRLVGMYLKTVRITSVDAFLMSCIRSYCTYLEELSLPVWLQFARYLKDFNSLKKLYFLRNSPMVHNFDVVEYLTLKICSLPQLGAIHYCEQDFFGICLKVLTEVRELYLIDCFFIAPEHLKRCFMLWVHLQKIHVTAPIIRGSLLDAMSKLFSLSYVSCCVENMDCYECIATLPLLKYLQIWSHDRGAVRPELLQVLCETKADRLHCLRIYNAQLTLENLQLIGKLTALKELKVIFPRSIDKKTLESLYELKDLEYLQVVDYRDRDVSSEIFLDHIPNLIRRWTRLRYINLCFLRNLSFDSVYDLIRSARDNRRLNKPLKVYTYCTRINQTIYDDAMYIISRDFIRINCQEQTKEQLNALSLMRCYK